VRASARDKFVAFSSDLEGSVDYMYLDIKGLVTTAIGILIDPVSYAVTLPWRWKEGTPRAGEHATEQDIRDEWNRIKAHPYLAHWGHRPAAGLTNLRLGTDGVMEATMRKADEFVSHLRARYLEWDTWPADAQLATLSMAWACGPGFWRIFGNLHSALLRKDFAAAAGACGISTAGNPGIIPRNSRNVALYTNAARVMAHGLDADRLWWPGTPTLTPSEGAPTLPELPDPPETLPELVGPQGTAEGLAEWAIEQHRRDRGEG
jgi:hypothetical protein